MVLVAINLHATGDFHHLPVDTDVQITLTAHSLEEFTVMTLTTANEWSQDKDTMTCIVVEDHINHLLFCILHHLLTSSIAVSTSGTGKEQTQVVVDLCCRANSRTGILIGGFLLDTDNGRQTSDLIHVRALHTTKEVTGISRECLDIAPLSFGKDRVKGQ